jgi:hypothetical protein
LEEGFGGEKRPKDRVTLQIILEFTLSDPQNIYLGHVCVFDKYLHWPPVSVTIKIYINPTTKYV